MHTSSFLKMEWFVQTYLNKEYGSHIRVLDIGSYDVNGSYRCLFEDARFEYVGLDMEHGPNVDICPQNAYSWDEINPESFDVVISGQALEHIEFPWVTLTEIARVLRPGGLMAILAPQGIKYHPYPTDCYRYFADGLVALARYSNIDVLHASTNMAPYGAPHEWYSLTRADSFLIGQKPLDAKPSTVAVESYTFTPFDKKKLETQFITAYEQDEITKHQYISSALQEIASEFIELGQHDLAISSLLKALSYDDNKSPIYMQLSHVYNLVGNIEKAIQEVQRAIADQKDNPNYYQKLGHLLKSKGDLHGAKKTLERAITLDSSMPDAYMQLSHINHQLGDSKQAIQHVRQAIALKDTNPKFYHHLGNLLKKSGDIEGAKQAMENALALDPSLADLHIQLSHIYNQQENTQLAIQHTQQAIELKNDNPAYYHHLGNLLMKSGDLQGAKHALEHAMALDPLLPGPYIQLSRVYSNQGNIELAIQQIQKAIDIQSKNPTSYHHLGNLLIKHGNKQGAKHALEKAVALDPSLPDPRIQLSHVYFHLGNTELAIHQAQKAIAIQNNPAWNHHLEMLLKLHDDAQGATEAHERKQ